MCAKLIIGAKVIEHQKWGFAEKVKRYNENVTSQDKANAERKLKEKYLSKSYETYSYPFYGKGARDYDCNFSETYIQDLSSATTEFIPKFDLTGI